LTAVVVVVAKVAFDLGDVMLTEIVSVTNPIYAETLIGPDLAYRGYKREHGNS